MASCAARLSLVFWAAAFWFYASVGTAHACVCLGISPSEAFAGADSVFAGTVVSANYFEPSPGQFVSDTALLEFKVHTVWKGVPYEAMFVKTVGLESACGIPRIAPLLVLGPQGVGFVPEYLVYVNDGWADLCTGTKLAADTPQDIAWLGEGQPPVAGSAAPLPEPDPTHAATPLPTVAPLPTATPTPSATTPPPARQAPAATVPPATDVAPVGTSPPVITLTPPPVATSPLPPSIKSPVATRPPPTASAPAKAAPSVPPPTVAMPSQPPMGSGCRFYSPATGGPVDWSIPGLAAGLALLGLWRRTRL